MEGRETGDFDPAANINRAEAAKLVAALNLAGVPVPEANGVSSFEDVLGDGSVAWANDYIEYCVSQGSVNGIGNDLFAPKANVTGVQFAKMLLGILGYKADVEEYTGANWEYNVNIDAVKAGLYIGLKALDVTAPLSRDDAAQMMYNALKAFPVIYLTDTTGALKLSKDNLLETIYPTVVGFGNQGKMTAIKYNTDKGEYTYYIDGKALADTTTADYTDMLGMNVMYIVDRVDGILGVYAYNNGAVSTGIVGDYADIDSDDFDANDKIYQFTVSCDGTIHLAALQTAVDTITAAPYSTYKTIDNDNDGDIDVTIVYPVSIADVAFVGEKFFEVRGSNTDLMYDDYNVYTGMAEDDVIAVTPDTTLVAKCDVTLLTQQKGVVDAFGGTNSGPKTITVNGSTYDLVLVGKNITYYTINGYAIRVLIDSTVAWDELLLVTAMASGYDKDGNYGAYAMFSDGEIKPILISKLNGDDDNVKNIAKYLEKAENGKYGYLAKYDEVNGAYELTGIAQINSPADLGFDNTTHFTSGNSTFVGADKGDTNATINGYEFADDAVVYVATVDGDKVEYSVKTGTEVQTLNGMTSVRYAGVEYNSADGYTYVTFAFIQTDNVSEEATIYGVLTSEVTYYDGTDADYASFTMWNGTENVTMYAELVDAAREQLVEGDVIQVTPTPAEIYTLKATDGNGVAAVTAYKAGKDVIELNGVEKVLRDDVVVISFDTSKVEGRTDGIVLATTASDGATAGNTFEGKWNNVFYAYDAQGKIALIVVDNTEGGYVANDNNKGHF